VLNWTKLIFRKTTLIAFMIALGVNIVICAGVSKYFQLEFLIISKPRYALDVLPINIQARSSPFGLERGYHFSVRLLTHEFVVTLIPSKQRIIRYLASGVPEERKTGIHLAFRDQDTDYSDLLFDTMDKQNDIQFTLEMSYLFKKSRKVPVRIIINHLDRMVSSENEAFIYYTKDILSKAKFQEEVLNSAHLICATEAKQVGSALAGLGFPDLGKEFVARNNQ